MMWTDGKALLWLSAFFFIILPIFLGGLAGGVVGGLTRPAHSWVVLGDIRRVRRRVHWRRHY